MSLEWLEEQTHLTGIHKHLKAQPVFSVSCEDFRADAKEWLVRFREWVKALVKKITDWLISRNHTIHSRIDRIVAELKTAKDRAGTVSFPCTVATDHQYLFKNGKQIAFDHTGRVVGSSFFKSNGWRDISLSNGVLGSIAVRYHIQNTLKNGDDEWWHWVSSLSSDLQGVVGLEKPNTMLGNWAGKGLSDLYAATKDPKDERELRECYRMTADIGIVTEVQEVSDTITFKDKGTYLKSIDTVIGNLEDTSSLIATRVKNYSARRKELEQNLDRTIDQIYNSGDKDKIEKAERLLKLLPLGDNASFNLMRFENTTVTMMLRSFASAAEVLLRAASSR